MEIGKLLKQIRVVKKTRPLSFAELEIILIRFEMMLQQEPNRYTIQEFIQQEDFRRELFKF